MKSLLLTVGAMSLVSASTALAHDVNASNEDVIKQIYADFAVGNMDGFADALAPNIVWNEADNNPFVTGSPYIGVDAVMTDVMGPIGKDFSSFTVIPERYLVDGNTVAMIGRYNASYRPTGKTMTPQIVHVWTLDDGHVTAFQQYGDTAAMRDVTKADTSKSDLSEKLINDYVAAVNSNKIDRVLPLMTEDVVFQNNTHSGELVGAAAVKEWAAAFFEGHTANYQKTVQDFHLAEDQAVQRYTYTFAVTNKASGDVTLGDGKGVIFYQKEADGRWRVALDSWSDNPAADY